MHRAVERIHDLQLAEATAVLQVFAVQPRAATVERGLHDQAIPYREPRLDRQGKPAQDELGVGADHPRFYPSVRTVNPIVPAIETLANNLQAPKFEFHPEYLKKGFTNNPGEVFARLVMEAGNDFPM